MEKSVVCEQSEEQVATVQANCWITPALADKLWEAAFKQRISKSEVMRRALVEYLQRSDVR